MLTIYLYNIVRLKKLIITNELVDEDVSKMLTNPMIFGYDVSYLVS